MKKISFLSLLLLFCLGMSAQGVQFVEKTFKETLAQAKADNKLVFVDCYTSWCGPCRKMLKEVFPLKEVGDFFSKTFVATKMDMEKGEGPAYNKQWDVNAYPTYIVFDGDGNEKGRLVGYQQPKQLIDTLTTIVANGNISAAKEKYEHGDRSTETIKAYIDELIGEKKISALTKVVADFIDSKPEMLLTDTTVYNLFIHYIQDPHYPCFLWAYSHKADMVKAHGEQIAMIMESVWSMYCRQTYIYDEKNNFVGFDEKKLDEYKQFMKDHGVAKAALYVMEYKLPCSDQMGNDALLKNLEESATMKDFSSSQWTFFADRLQGRLTDKTMLKRLNNARKLRAKTDNEK